MTVATSNSRDAYNCSGGTTYDFHFGVGATSEVKVVLTDESSVETILTETTHYTISATNSDFSSGGTVTTVSAYAAPNKITIVSNVPLTQESDFTEGMATLYETFESGLDKLTRIVQQHNEIIVRSLTLPLSSASISALLPVPVANAYLAINSAGTAFEMRSPAAQGSISDEAYDAATWLSATTVAPSKKAVRDVIETKTAFATAAEITTGTEPAKAIAPDQAVLALMKKTGSNLAIGSDADGDMYYRAAGVLTRLAKGAANLKMFMNAGATAPEWATGMKVIGISRDLSSVGAPTDVAYTGVGFKPNAMIAIGAVHATNTWSIGIAAGSENNGIGEENADKVIYRTGNVINAFVGTNGSTYQYAVVKTWDADGFTLTWTKVGSPTGSFSGYCLCFR